MHALPLDAFHRQSDLLVPEELAGRHVDVVGAGSLGGAIALCLAKMGFGIQNRITVSDFDRCEAHNLATQWFRPTHVQLDQTKVEALSETIAWVCDRQIVTVPEAFRGDEERPVGPIVILAVDSLEERRRIWRQLRRRSDVQLLVDARMGAEVTEIYCLDLASDNFEDFEQSMESPGDALMEACTRQAILYTTLGTAALVGSLLRGWIRGERRPGHLVFDWRNYMVSAQ